MSVIVSTACTFLIVRDTAETSVFTQAERSECNVVAVLYPDGRRRLRVIYTSGPVGKGTELSPDDARLMTPRHFESTYALLMKGLTKNELARETTGHGENSPVHTLRHAGTLF